MKKDWMERQITFSLKRILAWLEMGYKFNDEQLILLASLVLESGFTEKEKA